MLEYSHVGLAFMWYVFYFKFPPLKTFTRKTLQLSSEGIIVKRGNSYEKISMFLIIGQQNISYCVAA